MNQPIEIVRGTTNIFAIELVDADDQPYELSSGERLIFGIKLDKDKREYDLSKTLTSADAEDGKYNLVLNPADTENLLVAQYYYDIGLQSGQNYFMVVECSPFLITHNITKRAVT